MNRLFGALVGAFLQLAVIAMAIVLALLFFALIAVLLTVWLARLGWARLTGRPIAPWAMPFDARRRFGDVYGAAGRWPRGRGAGQAARAGDGDSIRRTDADVSNVDVVREISRSDQTDR